MAVVQTRREILQSLASTSFNLSQSPFHLPSQPNPFAVNPLVLTPALQKFEADLSQSRITTQAEKAALCSASELVKTYKELFVKHSKRLQGLSQTPGGLSVVESIDGLRRTYQHQFEHHDLPKLLAIALKSKASDPTREHSTRSSGSPPPRRIFNHAFTPYLEAYFEQNAFPSHADQQALAKKSGMTVSQIINWFQNHRSRARSKGNEADLKRLPPGQAINEEFLQERIKYTIASHPDDALGDSSTDEESEEPENHSFDIRIDLDALASSSTDSVAKTYPVISAGPCVADSDAFGLPTPSRSRTLTRSQQTLKVEAIDSMFGEINIRMSTPSKSVKSSSSKSILSTRASTPKASARRSPLKAALRSCFSSAITLTCPRSHPALIRQKDIHTSTPPRTNKLTVLEQKRAPVQPYTLPNVLPTWELPAAPEAHPQPLRRKKPTIASHARKVRPGSPYPKQPISRMSSASSLASMASDDSQSSSRSTSSAFSASTADSSELDTPAQSPSPDNAELIDDVRFSDDMFGDYLFYSNPMPDNFFFDVNVEQPFDKDVSLSVAEFDKSVSLSIAEFDTTTLPSFDFFES